MAGSAAAAAAAAALLPHPWSARPRPPPNLRVQCGVSNKPKRSPFAPHTLESWLVSTPANAPSRDLLRKPVLDYLASQGISGREIQTLDLSLSLDVVRERLDFIRTLGLENPLILRYPLILTCSIRRNMVPVINFLESLGVTPEQLPIILNKFPMILYSSILVDLQPVVEFLLGLGISPQNLPQVLVRFPDVLGFQLEGTMSTSVAYLVSLGVDTRQLGSMLTHHPEILGMKVGGNIKRKVEFYSDLGFAKREVVDLLERHPYVLGYELEHVKPQVKCLLAAGIREKDIPSLISRFPGILALDLSQKIPEKTVWLVDQARVPPSDVHVVLQKLPQIVAVKEAKAMKKVKYLTAAGVRGEDVGRMIVECPQILAVRFEGTLKRNMRFFQRAMKRPLEEVVEFPGYLTYSLSRRIKPRFQLVVSNRINCSLAWFLDCSDEKFRRRLSVRYVSPPKPNGSEEQALTDEDGAEFSEAESSEAEATSEEYDSTESSETETADEDEDEEDEDEDELENC